MSASLTSVVVFLLTSARNLVQETPRYGPLRLLQACSRLVEVSHELGVAGAVMDEIGQRLAELEPLIMTDEERFKSEMDALICEVLPSMTGLHSERGDQSR